MHERPTKHNPDVRAGGQEGRPVAEFWYAPQPQGDGTVRFKETWVAPYAVGDIWLVRGPKRDLVVDTGSGIVPLAPREPEPSSMSIGTWSRSPLRASALLLALALMARWIPAHAQDSQAIDLELALLVDVSASVSDEEFRLQADGLAAAFRSTVVLDAIRAAAGRGIAVGVIQWANRANQRISVDWTLVQGEADALWLAARIASMPRLIHGGHTALGDALVFAMQEFESNRFVGLRRVIDLSGDGRNNDGHPLRSAREEVIKHGITINGLAILSELPQLDQYFRDYLIGGEGAFFMVAQDYVDFAQAMIHKLAREIRSVPLSENEAPNPKHKARTELSFATSRIGGKFRDRPPFKRKPSARDAWQ